MFPKIIKLSRSKFRGLFNMISKRLVYFDKNASKDFFGVGGIESFAVLASMGLMIRLAERNTFFVQD
jgi:hypothetical protein